MKQRGILTIAAGHPNWGRYAYNLCMSIRATDPSAKVSVAHYGSGLGHLAPHMKMAFDEIIEIPDEYVHKHGHEECLKSKMFMYNLSPYKETIFLDADTIWLPKKKVSEVFESMKDDLLFQCRGRFDIKKNQKSLWTTTQAVRAAYKITSGYFYNISSEFVYFIRSKDNSAFFKLAQKEYDHLKVRCDLFGGATPDELPFSIAMLKREVRHKSEYHPVYWESEQKKLLEPAQMHAQYIAYSMGGSHQDRNMVTFYNNLVKYYARKWAETTHFLWLNKQLWQPLRTTV